MPIENILFATDFSKSSENALAHALLVGAQHRARLHIVYVQAAHQSEPGKRLTFPGAEELGSILQSYQLTGADISQWLRDNLHTHVHRAISPGPGILEYAQDQKCDLIVVGTHGRRSLPHVLLGSVAEYVTRLADVPVLVVGSQKTHKPRGSRYQRVLVPVDFSAASVAALAAAATWTTEPGDELIAMHSVEEVPNPAFYLYGRGSILEFFPDMHDRIREHLQQTLAPLKRSSLHQHIIVCEGRAHRKIAEEAREHAADLVVMAPTGLGKVERWLMGSVTTRVLRTCSTPVLVVRSTMEHVTDKKAPDGA